ncbi:hypothetical protein SAMN05216503_1253 [Polaribacter sp. KT25b]|uniref:hypothetical protein n=1 Tax=Polaribacter sp. KT25b TaxID=1855336 RepID=UPI00087C0CA3|nr:hypothetical protein [Polaribacter sp. KT25b]SDR87948.1 hypothetical protein SAMN05216503_1253 [Polaribacter sp. KT25b]
MKTIIKKPHIFFFSLIPLFIIFAIIKKGGIIDITINNTFFAVKIHYWCYFSAVFTALIGINYYMLYWAKKRTVHILSLFHILFQFAALIPFTFCIFFLNTKVVFTKSSIDFYYILSISYILFTISICLHILNFILTILRKTS